LKAQSPAKKKVVRSNEPSRPLKLDTLAATRVEMARVYRMALRGSIEPEMMTKLVYALKEIRACIELDLLDEAPRRLAELEASLGKRRD
jgi:hypothetical protein